jgi:hypothetical protein
MFKCLHDFLGARACSFLSALGLGLLVHDPNEDCPTNLALKAVLDEIGPVPTPVVIKVALLEKMKPTLSFFLAGSDRRRHFSVGFVQAASLWNARCFSNSIDSPIAMKLQAHNRCKFTLCHFSNKSSHQLISSTAIQHLCLFFFAQPRDCIRAATLKRSMKKVPLTATCQL